MVITTHGIVGAGDMVTTTDIILMDIMVTTVTQGFGDIRPTQITGITRTLILKIANTKQDVRVMEERHPEQLAVQLLVQVGL